LQLAAEGFELAETSFATVDRKACVEVRGGAHELLLDALAARNATASETSTSLCRDLAGTECVASRELSFGRHEQVLDLEHYQAGT